MAVVWVLGSVNVDAVVRVAALPKPGETVLGGPTVLRHGGKGANQALAAARAGAAVRMIGRVGGDAEGTAYRDRLRAAGIDVTALRVDAAVPTGRAAITVSDDGENTIVVSPGANAAVHPRDLDVLRAAKPDDVLLAQLELPLEVVVEAARRAKSAGIRFVLNAAPYAELPDDVLQSADPLIVNETEYESLAAHGAVPEQVLVTRGAAGSEWGRIRQAAVAAEQVVDTTGAGDAYCGTLAAALAAGHGCAAAMRLAAAAASASVAWEGAQPEQG